MSVSIGPKITVMSGALQGDLYTAQGNAMLRALQALLQTNTISIGLTTPPSLPNDGDTYIVGSGATGAWTGKGNNVAYWTMQNPASPGGEWDFYPPFAGWVVGNQQDNSSYVFDGTVWKLAIPSPANERRIGMFTREGGSGPTVQTFGDDYLSVNSTPITTVDPTDDNGPVITIAAGLEAVDSAYGFSGDIYWRTGRNIATWVSVYFPGPTDIRTWVALTDEAGDGDNTFGSTDTPSGNFAAFRYSTAAGDATWQCITSNGSATTKVSTSVAFDTNEHAWGIKMDDNNGKVSFYIDGVLVGVISTHLPAPSLNLRVYVTSCKHLTPPTGSDVIGLDQVHTSADTKVL